MIFLLLIYIIKVLLTTVTKKYQLNEESSTNIVTIIEKQLSKRVEQQN